MSTFSNLYPYTDEHNLNLDWIIKEVTRLGSEMGSFKANNTITYKGIWNISNSYSAWDVVAADDYTYIAKKPVPAGTQINNTDYWSIMAPISTDTEAREKIVNILKDITSNYEENNTATRNYSTGNILVIGSGKLYKVTSNISIGSTISEDSNVEEITINELFEVDTSLSTYSNNSIANKTVSLKFQNVDSDINDIRSKVATRDQKINQLEVNIQSSKADLANETSARKLADNTINERIDDIISGGSVDPDAELVDARTTWYSTTKSNAGSAIREATERNATDIEISRNEGNLFSIQFATYNKQIQTDGSIIDTNNWYISDYIYIPDNCIGIRCFNYGYTPPVKLSAVLFACYSASKVFIGYVSSKAHADNGLEDLLILPNTRYVRVQGYYEQIDLQKITLIYPDKSTDYAQLAGVHMGGFINSEGAITNDARFGYTDYIKVPSWAKAVKHYNSVTISGYGEVPLSSAEFAKYDNDLNFIADELNNYETEITVTPIDPEKTAYIRMNFGAANTEDYSIRFIPDYWSNTTGNFLGDSFTSQELYTNALNERFGIEVNNYGVSGSSISNISGSSTAFWTRVNSMSEDCDFVFIQGGTNDWGLSAPIGNKTDTDSSTFYGGLYKLFEALRSRYPDKFIAMSNILPRNFNVSYQAHGMDSNDNGDSVMDFNEAIKYMASRYGIIVIDAFSESGICFNNLDIFTDDGLHPNQKGAKRYAISIMETMNRYTPYESPDSGS